MIPLKPKTSAKDYRKRFLASGGRLILKTPLSNIVLLIGLTISVVSAGSAIFRIAYLARTGNTLMIASAPGTGAR